MNPTMHATTAMNTRHLSNDYDAELIPVDIVLPPVFLEMCAQRGPDSAGRMR